MWVFLSSILCPVEIFGGSFLLEYSKNLARYSDI